MTVGHAGPYGTWKGGREKAPAAFCRKVLTSSDEIEMWGDGQQTRSFTYIDDCVEGILRITKSDFREVNPPHPHLHTILRPAFASNSSRCMPDVPSTRRPRCSWFCSPVDSCTQTTMLNPPPPFAACFFM